MVIIDNNVPDYLKSEGIQTGYRICKDYKSCLKSLFYFHNETANCWTMIITAIMSTCFFIFAVNQIDSKIDQIPFILFWLSCVLHLPFSVGYHLFGCIDATTHNL